MKTKIGSFGVENDKIFGRTRKSFFTAGCILRWLVVFAEFLLIRLWLFLEYHLILRCFPEGMESDPKVWFSLLSIKNLFLYAVLFTGLTVFVTGFLMRSTRTGKVLVLVLWIGVVAEIPRLAEGLFDETGGLTAAESWLIRAALGYPVEYRNLLVCLAAVVLIGIGAAAFLKQQVTR